MSTDAPYQDGLEALPLRWLRRAIAAVKRRFFTVDWPEEPDAVLIDGTPAEFEEWIRETAHAEGVDASYHYDGQVLEVRIPWGLDAEGKQRVLHIRARLSPGLEGLLEAVAHLEYSRYEHPDLHVAEVGLDWETGLSELSDLVDAFHAAHDRA